jgi:hypothetical protein
MATEEAKKIMIKSIDAYFDTIKSRDPYTKLSEKTRISLTQQYIYNWKLNDEATIITENLKLTITTSATNLTQIIANEKINLKQVIDGTNDLLKLTSEHKFDNNIASAKLIEYIASFIIKRRAALLYIYLSQQEKEASITGNIKNIIEATNKLRNAILNKTPNVSNLKNNAPASDVASTLTNLINDVEALKTKNESMSSFWKEAIPILTSNQEKFD